MEKGKRKEENEVMGPTQCAPRLYTIETPQRGWHFLSDNGLLRDGKPPPPPGKWLEWDATLIMCMAGLHWSREPLQALSYAPGSIVCHIEAKGETIEERSKLCSRYRRIIWQHCATEALDKYTEYLNSQLLEIRHVRDRKGDPIPYNIPHPKDSYFLKTTHYFYEVSIFAARIRSWADSPMERWKDQNNKLKELLVEGWKTDGNNSKD